nr:hypothetical protein PFHMJSLL_PFHMJSLL_CDS_0004 [Microvirus sp.]
MRSTDVYVHRSTIWIHVVAVVTVVKSEWTFPRFPQWSYCGKVRMDFSTVSPFWHVGHLIYIC